MVWPKRRIQLLASSADPGIDGVRAVLKGIQLEFFEAEDLDEENLGNWWEKPFAQRDSTERLGSTTNVVAGPATDLVFWSEDAEHKTLREKALARGMNQQSIQSFIHNILENEVILRVSEPTVFIEGRPLLGHVLQEAGFEPTILWPTTNGVWQCERRQGNHWVIPESWQVSSCEAGSAKREISTTDLGHRAASLELHSDVRGEEKATWVVRENRLDFYQAQDGLKFVGQIPRWPEPREEQVAAETIARCIDLGVSWLDIRLALSSIWQTIIKTDNLRCNINDIGWNARSSREELPSVPIDHVEDWWAR